MLVRVKDPAPDLVMPPAVDDVDPVMTPANIEEMLDGTLMLKVVPKR